MQIIYSKGIPLIKLVPIYRQHLCASESERSVGVSEDYTGQVLLLATASPIPLYVSSAPVCITQGSSGGVEDRAGAGAESS